MDENPKSIWKKSFTGRMALVVWLAVGIFTVMLGSFIIALLNYSRPISDTLMGVGLFAGVFLAACLTIIYLIWPLLRLLFWKHWRRTMFGLVCFATLIALFYAEENWRGKHDWEKFKHEWEAKGEKFDFKDFIPPPVPDDQNFAMSPVWIAEVKFTFQNTPERAKAWYGDRIYSDEVSKIVSLLPVSTSGVVGTNWWSYSAPRPPEASGNWAAGRTTDLKPWQSYYRDVGTTNPAAEIPVAPRPQTPAQDVLLALSKFDPVIEKLRTDSARPDSRFPLGYEDENKAAILLPHLTAVKRFAQVLQLRALAELKNGQSEQALADIKLMLRLTASVRSEPFLISHLVRIAVFQITLQPVNEGLAGHNWSDAQLAELNSEMAKLDFLADYRLSMHGEMGFQEGIVRYLQAHPQEYSNLTSYSNDHDNKSTAEYLITAALRFHLVPSGWFYQNRLRCARDMEEFYLPAADVQQQAFLPALVRRGKAAVESDQKNLTSFNILARVTLPALGNAAKKFAYAQASVDLARVAIALERYRLAHGEYPESLDTLAPQFIAQVPHDVIGDGPLHYRRTSDGQFVLYSVGWNERDDGGVVVFGNGVTPNVDINEGDWVWRYPTNNN